MFGYARKGRRATLGFFRAPEDAMESPELMLPWARSAYAAALRANAKKQVAAQAQAARKFAQTKPAKKRAAARPAQAAGRKPAKKTPRRAARK